MNRIIVFIDGFNLYHAIDKNPSYHKYKWLDFSKLAQCFVTKSDTIEEIIYFTALAEWSPAKMSRHKVFIRALRSCGIQIVYGKFRHVTRLCTMCGQYYQTYEEKRTDVNIAIYLLKLAIDDRYDTAMIISGDSDLIPAIQEAKNRFPQKNFLNITPIGRKAEAMKNACDYHMKMKEIHLKSSLFPDTISLIDCSYITKPSSWV